MECSWGQFDSNLGLLRLVWVCCASFVHQHLKFSWFDKDMIRHLRIRLFAWRRQRLLCKMFEIFLGVGGRGRRPLESADPAGRGVGQQGKHG